MPEDRKISGPRISIGLVVYNGAGHIRSALESIVNQPYRNIELVVVDGASTDGTQDILAEYAQHISVLLSEPDKGIYDAMNKVCSLATGDWLIFLGCDDVLLDVLGKVAELMVVAGTVYYGDAILRSTGKIYGGEFSKRRLMWMNFCHQTVFYPRSVYKKNAYSLDYKWLADYAYNLQLVGAGIPFAYLGEAISLFNDKGGSSQGDAEFEKKKISLIRASLGTTYALLEIWRRQKEITRLVVLTMLDKIAGAIGNVIKIVFPYTSWKFIRSLWRWLRNKY